MRKPLFLFMASVTLALSACHAEFEDPTVNPEVIEHDDIHLETVKVDLVGESGDEDTKSVVSTSVENFSNAYLFAFWSDSKKICTFTEGSKRYPVAKYITDKSFEWALPVGKDSKGNEQHIDIWVIVNPQENICSFLKSALSSGIQLTEDDFSELEYYCDDIMSLMDMDVTGMPMSGMVNNLYLPKRDTPFTLSIRRLFARYDIKFDFSAFINSGWNVQAVSVQSYNVNTTVPYFYTGSGVGFRQTENGVFSAVDRATSSDIVTINNVGNNGKSSDYITFYVLENCQGDILKDDGEPAASWVSVRSELGAKLEHCSYLQFDVKAISDDQQNTRTFPYYLYLGQDFKSNFDVIRNKRKKVTIKIGDPNEALAWMNSRPTTTKRHETRREYINTTFKEDELELPDFVSDDNVKHNKAFTANYLRDENDNLYCEITPENSAPVEDYKLIIRNKAHTFSDTKNYTVQEDYYAGFNLGLLPLESSLGYPVKDVPKVKVEDDDWDMSGFFKQTDNLRCVHFPDENTNPYLWVRYVDAEVGSLGDAFEEKYDIRLIVNGASDYHYGLDPRNSVCLRGIDGSWESDRYYYENLPDVPGSYIPALCRVEVHAKEDVNPEWVTWFEFYRLPQYECGLSLETSNTGSSYSDDEETWWTGAVSFGFFQKGNGKSRNEPENFGYLFDIRPETHLNVWIPDRVGIYSKVSNSAFSLGDINSSDYFGVRGYKTNVDVFWEQKANPLFVFQWCLPDHLNGIAIEDSFPDKFTPVFTSNVKPIFSYDLNDISEVISSGSDFVVIPSAYLSKRFGDGALCPGFVFSKPKENWHVRAEHVFSNPKDFVPASDNTNEDVFSSSYYQIELYPDASYGRSPFNQSSGGVSVSRHYNKGYGLKISTVQKDDLFPIRNISFDGNSGYVIVDGQQKKIEDVIDEIVVRYNEKNKIVNGRIRQVMKTIVLRPTQASQSHSFVWNNYAVTGYSVGYSSFNSWGVATGIDKREPITLKGWQIDSFSASEYTHNPWDDFSHFTIKFKSGYGTYTKNGKVISFDTKTIFQEPAVGAN